jgi:CBS domain-containing protein
MKVGTILDAKGHQVETVKPDTPVVVAVHRLTALGIGALVVSADGQRSEGTLSERDVVRGLARHGAAVLEMPVREVMSSGGPVCSPEDTLKRVMAEMTDTRHRHLPVVEGDRLVGIVSIGDIVKNRLEEMDLEAKVLRDAYIRNR